MLPKPIQQLLKQAAAQSPQIPFGHCTERTLAIDTIIDEAKRKHSHLFVADALPPKKLDGGFRLKRFSKYCD